METVIGMVLAFILGAFVRSPFPLKVKEDKPKTEAKEEADDGMTAWLRQQAEAEKERNRQLFTALNWNGKAGDHED